MAPAARMKGLLAVLVCVHCSLTFFVALGGLLFAGAAAPTLLGVPADLVLVPLTGLTLFVGWLWWGKRSAAQAEAAACATPMAGPTASETPGKPDVGTFRTFTPGSKD